MKQWVKSFKKKEKPVSQVMLTIRDGGLSIVVLSPEGKLQHCAFVACEDADQRVKVLANFVQKHQLKGAHCYYVLQPSQYRLLLMDAPNVPEEERRQAAKWLVKDLIKYPIETAAVEVFEVPARLGQPPRIYVVTMPVGDLEAVDTLVTSARMQLVSVNIMELALNALMDLQPDRAMSLAMLYQDDKMTHLLIVKDGLVRMIRDVAKAEQLEDENRFPELVLELQRSLDYYQTQLAEAAPVRLLVTPRIGMIKPLMRFLSEQLAQPVDIIDIQAMWPGHSVEQEDMLKCLTVLGEAKRWVALNEQAKVVEVVS